MVCTMVIMGREQNMTNTWDNSIFEAVEKTINNCLENTGKRNFEWNFPRQCGVTTYLANKVITDVLFKRRQVAVVGPKWAVDNIRERFRVSPAFQTADIDKNNLNIIKMSAGGYVKFVNISKYNHSSLNNLRGMSLDRIYIDNWIYETTPEMRREFLNAYLPTICGGKRNYILALNTTEG